MYWFTQRIKKLFFKGFQNTAVRENFKGLSSLNVFFFFFKNSKVYKADSLEIESTLPQTHYILSKGICK